MGGERRLGLKCVTAAGGLVKREACHFSQSHACDHHAAAELLVSANCSILWKASNPELSLQICSLGASQCLALSDLISWLRVTKRGLIISLPQIT